jgi:hypothetical protein
MHRARREEGTREGTNYLGGFCPNHDKLVTLVRPCDNVKVEGQPK